MQHFAAVTDDKHGTGNLILADRLVQQAIEDRCATPINAEGRARQDAQQKSQLHPNRCATLSSSAAKAKSFNVMPPAS